MGMCAVLVYFQKNSRLMGLNLEYIVRRDRALDR